jgi:hypothetical protein
LFKFREAGRQVPLVTMSHPSLRTAASPPCLPLGIKDSLKEDRRLLDERKLFGEGRLFDEGRLLEEGGLLKGKELLKGNELLKENC